MAAAIEAGCEYAVVVTQGGTISQRNAERLGFRVAYSKVTVIQQIVNTRSNRSNLRTEALDVSRRKRARNGAPGTSAFHGGNCIVR